MITYIVKRLVFLTPLLFGITLITFSLLKAIPGDPVYSLVGERTSPDIVEKIRKEIGADKSFFQQYLGYIFLLTKGDMGRSYFTNRSVMDDIVNKFPNTLLLAACAMLVAAPTGVLFGYLAAIAKGSRLDTIISGVSLVSLSIPVFWSGLVFMLLFGLAFNILPPSGTGGLNYLVLPALTLSLPAFGTISRITRTMVRDIVNMPFVVTARAKGISEQRLHAVHILKNALIPVITIIGLEFGSYLNGAVLTETIFGWDGIGRFAMEGIVKRDYPVIMGSILTGTVIFVFLNLLVDIIYHSIDPRLRTYGTKR